jgi:tetratricopeptide (TPR) repeat protein
MEPPRAAAEAARSAPRSRRAAALIALPLGAALAYLGICHTTGALLALRGDAVLERYEDRRDAVPRAEAMEAVALLERADAWQRDPGNSFNAGRLLMRLATPPAGGGPYDPILLERAQRHFERSLAEAPANAAAWAALADTRLLRGAPAKEAADALSMSIQLARYDPALLAWRCRMGLVLYPSLDAARRAEVGSQIRLLGRQSARELIRVARSTGMMAVVITALSGDNETLNEFLDGLRHVK